MDFSYMKSVVDGKKNCKGCNQWLDTEKFNTYKKNGKTYLQYMCRDCRRRRDTSEERREKDRESYKKNKHKYREQQRIYNSTDRAKELNRKRSKKYWDANPEKNKARKKIRTCIRNGSIVRPEVCSRCGKKGKIEAHHKDYNKPLDVVWLCRKCHVDEHKYFNKK